MKGVDNAIYQLKNILETNIQIIFTFQQMCFSKLGWMNYSCLCSFLQYFKKIYKLSIIFISLRDNVLLMATHQSQLSLAVNKEQKAD